MDIPIDGTYGESELRELLEKKAHLSAPLSDEHWEVLKRFSGVQTVLHVPPDSPDEERQFMAEAVHDVQVFTKTQGVATRKADSRKPAPTPSQIATGTVASGDLHQWCTRQLVCDEVLQKEQIYVEEVRYIFGSTLSDFRAAADQMAEWSRVERAQAIAEQAGNPQPQERSGELSYTARVGSRRQRFWRNRDGTISSSPSIILGWVMLWKDAPDPGDAQMQDVPYYREHGPLARLDSIVYDLAGRYAIEETQVLQLLLWGEPPHVHRITAHFDYQPALPCQSRITLRIDPTVPPREVMDAYAEFRRDYLIERPRQPDPVSLRMVAEAAATHTQRMLAEATGSRTEPDLSESWMRRGIMVTEAIVSRLASVAKQSETDLAEQCKRWHQRGTDDRGAYHCAANNLAKFKNHIKTVRQKLLYPGFVDPADFATTTIRFIPHSNTVDQQEDRP